MQRVESDYQPNKLSITSLKNQAAFDIANKRGKKHHSRFFICITYKPDIPKDQIISNEIYLGLKISKKVGNAVVRNKARRRLKSLIRSCITSSIKHHQNRVFMIVAHKGIHDAPYAVLQEEFERILQSLVTHS